MIDRTGGRENREQTDSAVEVGVHAGSSPCNALDTSPDLPLPPFREKTLRPRSHLYSPCLFSSFFQVIHRV